MMLAVQLAPYVVCAGVLAALLVMGAKRKRDDDDDAGPDAEVIHLDGGRAWHSGSYPLHDRRRHA